jgi:hypothetical protein
LNLHYSPQREISAAAHELVVFDIASIMQVVAAARAAAPELWLASADQYENKGRLLRDSVAPRLLAYSPVSHTLYSTDGCNSCTHALAVDIRILTLEALQDFAKETEIDAGLLKQLKQLTTEIKST